MTTILIFCSLGLLIALAWHFFPPPKVFFPLEDDEDPSREELMEILWDQLSKQTTKQSIKTTILDNKLSKLQIKNENQQVYHR